MKLYGQPARIRLTFLLAALGPVIAVALPPNTKADVYQDRRTNLFRAPVTTPRRLPVIPPKSEKLSVIIDADAHNEIDDVWALALALLSPERFDIKGIVAANYDNDSDGAGPQSIATSAATIRTLLQHAGLTGKIPVKLGSAPMRYQFEPSESEGVDFIIEQAMAATPDHPLWIIGLGAATDLASAYLKEPRIADHVVIFWHGRTEWPQKATNFNVHGDVRAARVLFHSRLPFVLFDTGSRLYCPMEESAKWTAQGDLGPFLHEYRFKSEWYQSPTKGFYDLGDIAALLDPTLATWETVDGPEVGWDLVYHFTGKHGKILRCADINRDGTFAALTAKLSTVSTPPAPTAQREHVILDTDVGGDIDDAGAFAVMHALADLGEIEILAVGVVNGHELAVPYSDAINTWYGRPEIPIGTIKSQAPFVRDKYMAAIVGAYAHRRTQSAAPDVVSLYRRILAAQPDHSVTFVVIGPPTNISRLLDSKPDEFSPFGGVELMRRKVKFYGAGGNGDGKLPDGKPGFNYQMDIPAARNELAKLPLEIPVVFAGGSGFKLEIGSCYTETAPDHIIRRSFEAYFQGAGKLDRPTWDELRMLYACRPQARALFATSAPGNITMDENNYLHWTSQGPQNRAYAYVADWAAVRAELTRLMTHSRERPR